MNIDEADNKIGELKLLCKEKLGDFKIPSEFEFVKSLPKGPSGKILKRELRLEEIIVDEN